MRRILVTGASTWTGGQVVASLEQRPDTEVFGVDELPPRGQFASPFIMIGDDRTALADQVLQIEPDTVVHLLTSDRSADFGAGEAHDRAVVGNLALFGAAGRSDAVRRVVVKSDAAVYPLGPRSPSLFGEGDSNREKASRFGRSMLDVELAADALVARRPDVAVSVLRMAPIFGRTVDNPLSRYLRLPVVPTLLGFDPRWHLLHESDAVAAVLLAADGDDQGIVNIAAAGPMYLSRVIRLGRRVQQPMLGPALTATHRALGQSGIPVTSQLRLLLEHGAVLDTEAMRSRLRFHPQHSMRETVLAGYADPRPEPP
jgi:UDP-glucose 4-epimerase